MNLLENIRDGDEFAFKQLYEANKEKVFNYFLKKVNCSQDAEDLIQNTFFRLWKYRKSISENYLIDQQLFHIARTVFIDFTRRQNKINRIRQVATNIPQSYSGTQESILEQKSVERILKEMPELRRKAFILHKIEGFSYKEVASKLSVDVKSIDNNISRALKQIRKAMVTSILFLFLMN